MGKIKFFAFIFFIICCAEEKIPKVDVFFEDEGIFLEEFEKFPQFLEEFEIEVYEEDFAEEEIIPPECPGADYCPCEKNEDCYSGVCVIGEDERVCAEDCVEEGDCEKEGWSCVNLKIGPDIKSVCVYDFPLLCKPCKNDNDCVYEFGKSKSDCIEISEDGGFCFYGCKENSDCPKGYECIDEHCIPLDKKCKCVKKFIGYKTNCYKENEFGKCYYEVECTKDGFTECKAGIAAKEVCDSIDNNCDGGIDEGLGGKECKIKNEYGECKGETLCENGKIKCVGPEPKQEICNDKDDDCDNEIDEDSKDCTIYYRDEDGDGAGDIFDYKCLCKMKPPYVVIVGGDCNDEDPSINPKAEEKCNEIDDNCNSKIDEEGAAGCENFYKDNDGDGYGIKEYFKCLCKPTPPYSTKKELEDCNDDDGNINPGAKEECNGIDDNCNNKIDEEYPDLDGDKIADCVDPDKDGDGFNEFDESGKVLDCNDMEKEVNPSAKEECNAIDDNCNGKKDEGCPPALLKFIISCGGNLTTGEEYKYFGSTAPQVQGGKVENEKFKLEVGFYPTIK